MKFHIVTPSTATIWEIEFPCFRLTVDHWDELSKNPDFIELIRTKMLGN